MTKYNKRLDEILYRFIPATDYSDKRETDPTNQERAKQALTSLIKELVAEAKIDELKHLVNDDGIWYQDMTRQFPQKIRLDERIKELEV